MLLLAGMDEAETTAWRRFAAELGVLFQIVDDILDVTGTDAALGKPQRQRRAAWASAPTSATSGSTARATWPASATRPRAPRCAQAAPTGAAELEQITDFILTRTA